MRRIFSPRVLLAIAAVVSLVLTAGFVTALIRTDGESSAAADGGISTTTTSSTTPPTTTTTKPGLHQPPPAELPALNGTVLGPGSSGPVVAAYQQRLVDLKLDPGPVDGLYGSAMSYAVQAVQKIANLPRSGSIGEVDRLALSRFQYPQPLQADGEPNRTEINVTTQVLTLYESSQVRLITTTSTGSGEHYCYNTPRVNPTRRVCEVAATPSGRFTFREFRNGWDPSPLGKLYNPYYFHGGIAVHGYSSVPASPASHGCARIPMHIAEYFHTLVHNGDPVYVFGGQPAEVLSSSPIARPPTAPPTTTPPATPAPAPAPAPAPPPATTPPTTPPTTATAP